LCGPFFLQKEGGMLRKSCVIVSVTAVAFFLFTGCAKGRPERADIKATFDKITVGMDSEEVMNLFRSGADLPHNLGPINKNGLNRWEWYVGEGRYVVGEVTFENGKVVSKEWKGPRGVKLPPAPPEGLPGLPKGGEK